LRAAEFSSELLLADGSFFNDISPIIPANTAAKRTVEMISVRFTVKMY
jgi:hypothetical protein